jgi:hypothetical protein
MFETGNTPVRPPLRPPDQAAAAESARPADSQRPRPAPASSAPRYARRAHPAKGVSPVFVAAEEMTKRAANDIRHQHGQSLTRDECLRLVSVFRAGLVPRRRAGRRPKPQVTAAYLDWKAGMRGVALCVKPIPGWATHNRYRKIVERKALTDAIRSRHRRDREPAFPTIYQ